TNEDLTPLPLLTYLPISLSLKDKKCLVIGGGQVALRKIENLLDY
ncbi:MAG: NAD(P)-dependent oxidoreductase, partial [Elusimicrobia bacterium]|nr:NAD(P)-dependent oxidoreductase [Elusimicrobiota bacterium]